jgi:hypothetical protein
MAAKHRQELIIATAANDPLGGEELITATARNIDSKGRTRAATQSALASVHLQRNEPGKYRAATQSALASVHLQRNKTRKPNNEKSSLSDSNEDEDVSAGYVTQDYTKYQYPPYQFIPTREINDNSMDPLITSVALLKKTAESDDKESSSNIASRPTKRPKFDKVPKADKLG